MFLELVCTICHQIEGDWDDLSADFIPHHVCEAPSGTKNPVISARSRVSEGDRDDLRPDFIPHHVCEAPSGTKTPPISTRSR